MFPLRDNLRCLTFPLVTVAIIMLNCAAFIWEAVLLNSPAADSFLTWLMVPHDFVSAFQSGNPQLMLAVTVTLFSSMFLHGGLAHLAGNMIFLFTFGKAVEARLGAVRYAIFYLICGVLAGLVHIASDPASMVPTLGASGAIAGVLGAYLVLWPRAEITGLVVPFFIVRIRAYWFLAVWIVMQFLPIIQSGGDLTGAGVAYWAHIGGFVGGILLAGIVRLLYPDSSVCYIPDDCPPCDEPHTDESDRPAE